MHFQPFLHLTSTPTLRSLPFNDFELAIDFHLKPESSDQKIQTYYHYQYASHFREIRFESGLVFCHRVLEFAFSKPKIFPPTLSFFDISCCANCYKFPLYLLFKLTCRALPPCTFRR